MMSATQQSLAKCVERRYLVKRTCTGARWRVLEIDVDDKPWRRLKRLTSHGRRQKQSREAEVSVTLRNTFFPALRTNHTRTHSRPTRERNTPVHLEAQTPQNSSARGEESPYYDARPGAARALRQALCSWERRGHHGDKNKNNNDYSARLTTSLFTFSTV